MEEALRIQQKKHAKVNKWKLERFREAPIENSEKESKSNQASFDRTKNYLKLNKFKREKESMDVDLNNQLSQIIKEYKKEYEDKVQRRLESALPQIAERNQEFIKKREIAEISIPNDWLAEYRLRFEHITAYFSSRLTYV